MTALRLVSWRSGGTARIGVVQSDRGARLERVHYDPRNAQTQAHDIRSLGNQAVTGLGIANAPIETHIVRRIWPN